MDAEEVKEFDEQVKSILDGKVSAVEYTAEHKFDGVAVTLS